MKWILPTLCLPLLAACTSNPRVSDGVIGYTLEAGPDGMLVVYADEASEGEQATLLKIAAICSQRNGNTVSPEQLRISGQSLYEREIFVAIPVPTSISPAISGPPGSRMTQQIVVQEQRIPNTLNIREISAYCPNKP